MPPRVSLSDFATDAIDAEFVSGIEEAQERVEKFLQEKIVENVEIEGDVYIEVSQLGGGSTQILKSMLFSQGDEPPHIAHAIVDAAQEDGSAIGTGKIRYQVTIKGHKGRCAFSLEYAPRGFDDANEAPNARGLVAQAMNHTQEAWAMVKDMIKETRQEHKERVRADAEEIKSLRSREVGMIQTYAELFDGKHARDLEIKKIEKQESRKDEVAGMLLQGIPHIVNKIAGAVGGRGGDGKPIVQPESSPLEQMLYGFLSTFTPDQLQATVQTGQIQLRQDQMMGMLGLFQAVQEKAAATEAARQAHTNGTTGPATAAPAEPDPFPQPAAP